VALNYAHWGDKNRSLLWLEKACQRHSSWLVELKSETDFDSLRSDPRYTDPVHRIGFPD
jgi:hypothetical protein